VKGIQIYSNEWICSYKREKITKMQKWVVSFKYIPFPSRMAFPEEFDVQYLLERGNYHKNV
jgi:hypothetical protein